MSKYRPSNIVFNPFTFSKTKHFGLKSLTNLTYPSKSVFLGSEEFLSPITENPWHGGPPIKTSGTIPLVLLNNSFAVISLISFNINGTLG